MVSSQQRAVRADVRISSQRAYGGFQELEALFSSPCNKDHSIFWDLFWGPLFMETPILVQASTTSGVLGFNEVRLAKQANGSSPSSSHLPLQEDPSLGTKYMTKQLTLWPKVYNHELLCAIQSPRMNATQSGTHLYCTTIYVLPYRNITYNIITCYIVLFHTML